MQDNNLDPLTNLPKESNIAPIKFDPLKDAPSANLITPAAPAFNADEPFEFSTYKFDADKDRYLQKGMNQEAYRASNQSAPAQLFNTVAGGVVSAAGTALEDIGYMLDFDNNIQMLSGAEIAESNWLSNFGKGVKNWSNNKMPIYRDDPNQFFNFADPGSYFTALKGLIDNAAGFAVPGAGALKVLSMAQKLSRYSRLLRVSKPVAEMIKVTGAGYWSNVGESKMMALETFENTKEDLIRNHGKSEAEATKLAGEAARDMYMWNKAFIAADVFGLAGLSRMKGFTRNAIKEKDLLTVGQRYKKAFGTFSSDDLLAQGLSEYAEETSQEVLSKEAQYKATKPFKVEQDGTDLFVRAISTLMKGETQYQGIMGFIAGGGQRVITQKLAGDRTSALKAEFDAQQKIVEETKDFLVNQINNQKNLKDIMLDASLQNDEHMQSIVRRANLTQIAVRNFERGTTESLLRLLEDRVQKGEEGAQLDLDNVKKMEKQWVSDTRYADPSLQPKVFHARESLNMAKERLDYLNEQKKQADEEVVANPADGLAKIKAYKLDADVKEMEAVNEELKKALSKITSIKYGNEVRKQREELVAKVEQRKKQAIAQKKQTEKKDGFLKTAVKNIREKFNTQKDVKEEQAAQMVETTSVQDTQSVKETAKPEQTGQGADTTVPTVTKPKRVRKPKLEKKVEDTLIAENISPEEAAKIPATKTSTVTLDQLLGEQAKQEATVENKSHFAYVNNDGRIQLQDAIPGNEMPYVAQQNGNMIEVTPTANSSEGAVFNEEFNTLKGAFETKGVKKNDRFIVTSPAIYEKDGANWNLVKKGTIEKIVPVEKIEFTERQNTIRNLALEINGIVGEELDGVEELTASLTSAQKLSLMKLSTELFAKTAEMLLEENPNQDFNTLESYYRVMREISNTVSKKVMENIYPYIKTFYAPTFQIDGEIAALIAKVDFDSVFLSDEEIKQLIDTANKLMDASLPEEMLTEEKLLFAEETFDDIQEDGEIKLTNHTDRDIQYPRKETAANFLAFLHRPYVQVDTGGEIIRIDEEGFIDDYAAILDDDIVYEGAQFPVEVVDDNSIPMYVPGGLENETTTWGEIKSNAEKYMEYYGFKNKQDVLDSFIPLAVKHNGKIIAYIHNIEFINPSRVSGNAQLRQQDAKALLAMRKQMIHGAVKNIKIASKTGGRIYFNEQGNPLSEIVTQEQNSQLSLGIMKEGQILGHNVKNIKNVDTDKLRAGLPYVFVKTGKNEIAIPAIPGKFDQETAQALVHAIFIGMHDGPLSPEIEAMVDQIRTTMGIDIRGEKGLQEYLDLFLFNFQPNEVFDAIAKDKTSERSYKSPLDAYILNTRGQLNDAHKFINFSGNSIDFGSGNASQTFSLSKNTPVAVKDSLKNILLEHIMEMRMQVSINKLSENKKTPVLIITAQGVKDINDGGTYLDFVKKGLVTKVRPIVIGDKVSFTYQPSVSFDPILEPAKIADMSGVINIEPGAVVPSPTAFSDMQFVKNTKANQTKVSKSMNDLNGYSDQQIIELRDNESATAINREAARQIFFERNLTDVPTGQTEEKVVFEEDFTEKDVSASSTIAQELGITAPKKRARKGNIVEDELIVGRQEASKVDNKCDI